MDMGFIRGAKQVVIISHHLLICAYQHESQIVRFVRIKLVQFQHVLHVVKIYKLVYDAVRVARNVAKGGKLSRRFIQALNRNDRE